MDGGKRLGVPAAVALAGVLALAGHAHAASVTGTVRPPSGCYKADCADFGGTSVAYVAEPNEANRLTVSLAGNALVFMEASLQVRARGVCIQRAASSASCEGNAITVSTGDGDDQVDAAAGVVDGGDGNDLLRGGGLAGGPGNDRLVGVGTLGTALAGGLGSDTLIGTAGRDRFVDGDPGEADAYEGGGGSDSISYAGRTSPVRLTLGAGGTEDTVSSVESVGGGNANDVLTGNAEANWIEGGLGRDVIAGGAGDDVLGAAGAPASALGIGPAVPTGPAYDPAAYGGDKQANEIDGGGGRDLVEGGAGPDRLIGGDGNDALSGAGGRNSILGGGGNDVLSASTSADRLDGGDGNDQIQTAGGGDRIRCGRGRDVVVAESFTKSVRGTTVPPDCESTRYGDEFTLVGHPRRTGRVVTVRLKRGQEPGRTDRIRLLSGRRLLGVSRRVTRSATYRVKLNRAGRRLARRGRTITVERRAVKKVDRDKESEHSFRYRVR